MCLLGLRGVSKYSVCFAQTRCYTSCSCSVCVVAAAGVYAAPAAASAAVLFFVKFMEELLVKGEQFLGVSAWSTAARYSIMGMPAFHTFELSFVSDLVPARSSQFLYNAGSALATMYVLLRHCGAVFNIGLQLLRTIRNTFYWPGPLWRRATRRKIKDAICAILALVAACLMLSNSASKPTPIADKWFPVPSVHTSTQRGTQAPTESSPLQQLAATLQPKSLAEEPSLQLHGAEVQQTDAMAVTSAPTDTPAQAPIPVAEPVTAILLPTKQSAHASMAIMVAQSRSLMLLPSSLVCPAMLPDLILIAETQQTLLVQPFLPGLLGYHHTSKEAAHSGGLLDTMPAAAAHVGGVAPPVHADRLCHGTCECCLMDSTSVSTAPAARHSVVVEHVAPTIAAVLPDLRSWAWFQTLLCGGFMFSLGAVIPGMAYFLCVLEINAYDCVKALQSSTTFVC